MLRNEKIISLAEAYKKMKEGELKGDQKELDLDDDGDIDGSDLKNLRKGKKDKDIGKDKVVINPKDDVEEGSCSSKMKKESVDLDEAVGTKTAYKIQELLGRLNVLLKPTSVMGKELISTRGAGFKKDLETALNHVKAIRDIVSDIEVELSMNEGKIDDLKDKMRAKKELSRGFDSKEKDKKAPSTRKVAGKSYGGSKSKDDLDEATKQDPNASDKEVLEPKVEGEKKFKLKHLIKKISDPGSSESK